jgi:hypothetical protein
MTQFVLRSSAKHGKSGIAGRIVFSVTLLYASAAVRMTRRRALACIPRRPVGVSATRDVSRSPPETPGLADRGDRRRVAFALSD